MGGVLAVIPAYSKSRRIPGKNMKLLGGKPLVQWTIEAALAAHRVFDVVVSTDWGAVRDLALGLGASVHDRQMEGGEASEVVAEVLRSTVFSSKATPTRGLESVAMLLPTSPFRTAQHIDEAVELHQRWSWLPNVLSVTHDPLATHKTFNLRGPYNLTKSGLGRPVVENGAVLVARAEKILADGFFDGEGAVAYVMDRESSIDLDWPDQWPQAEAIAARRLERVAA